MIVPSDGINVLSLFDGISCCRQALANINISTVNYFASEINKHAIEIAQANFPDTIQLGDIKQWRTWDLPNIDLITGGSPCFAKGVLVFTDKGYSPIETLVVGDIVLTHKNRFKKIKSIGHTFSSTIGIENYRNFSFRTTKNHPFFVMEKVTSDITDYNIPTWKPINDFAIDDNAVSLKLKYSVNDTRFSNIDLYILGRFLATGSYFKTKTNNSFSYKFKISIDKHGFEVFKNKVGNKFSYIEKHTTYDAFIHGQRWFKIGKLFGNNNNKYIPNFILYLPPKRLKIFLKGYFDGNAYNKQAINNNRKLVLTLGLAIQKCYNNTSKNNKISPNIFNNYIGCKIKKIPGHSILEKVYNIEVEDDNSYIVNNLIVHNCQGFSHAGKGLNFEDPRSRLLFDFIDILKFYKPKYFLLENVKMKVEWRDIITEMLKVPPHLINSNIFVPQNRQRFYWTNIPFDKLPPSKGLKIKDILETLVSKQYYLTEKQLTKLNLDFKWSTKSIKSHKAGKHQQDTIYHYNGIMGCLSAATHGAARHLTKTYLPDGNIRRLTEIECERLQGLPDNYTNMVASGNRYEVLGNGWTIPVIVHLLKNIN